MSRHPLRWESLVFGVLFLAIVANWSVWKQDLLTPRTQSLAASGVLILLGLLGVAATLWQARPARTNTPAPPTHEGPDDEHLDPQP